MRRRPIAAGLVVVAVVAWSGPGHSRSNERKPRQHQEKATQVIAVAPLRMSFPFYQFPGLKSEEQSGQPYDTEPKDGYGEPDQTPSGFIGWRLWGDKLRNDPVAICTLIAAAAAIVHYRGIDSTIRKTVTCWRWDSSISGWAFFNDPKYNYQT